MGNVCTCHLHSSSPLVCTVLGSFGVGVAMTSCEAKIKARAMTREYKLSCMFRVRMDRS